jgi:hypothetical protein
MQLHVRPAVSPDGQSVILSVNFQLTENNCQSAPLFPIQTTIVPVHEDGARGKPIPFTQFIQLPSFTMRGAHRFAVCGENQTMVIDCGRSTRVRETDKSVPFLCDLPVVGELFQSKSSEVVTDRLVVFVTPTVCTGEAGEECATPTAKACEELPLFAQPAMCEPETLPVAPRLACTPPCVAPCPTAADPAACVPGDSDSPVMLDMVVFRVSDDFFQRDDSRRWAWLRQDANDGQPSWVCCQEAGQFFIEAREKGFAKVLHEPRLVTWNGRPCTFSSGRDIALQNGAEIQKRRVGLHVALNPTISADRRSVRLVMQLERSQPCDQKSCADTEDGNRCQQSAASDRPTINVRQVDTAMCLPLGRAMVCCMESPCQTSQAKQRMYVLVTPRLIEPATTAAAPVAPPCVAPCPTAACPAVEAVTQEAAAATAPCGMWMMATPVTPPVPSCPAQAAPCPFACPVPPQAPVQRIRATAAVVPCSASDLPLVNLMIEYHEACAAGDRAKARNLAAKCIALDPMCFSR